MCRSAVRTFLVWQLFSEASLVNALFARMDANGNGYVSWYATAVRTAPASPQQNDAAAEPRG
jgi:hypothetical protein